MKVLSLFLLLLSLSFAFSRENRITGGNYAELGQFPYFAHIQIFNDHNLFLCGGALIRYNWVMTSAHCLMTWEHILVFLGSINKVEGPFEKTAFIDDKDHVRVHPEYNPSDTLYNDIALIYLQFAEPDWLNENVNVINLPQFSDIGSDFVGSIGTAAGFGLTDDAPGTGTSVYLKYVNMSIISNEECSNFWGEFITKEKICTDTTDGSTCAGDNGGGLIVEPEPGRKIVIGIGSFWSGNGCTVGDPAVFTRITKYLDWILDNLEEPAETTTPIQPPDNDRCVCECNCFTCPPQKRDEL